MSANVLILAGYGLNSEEELLFGFNHAGIGGRIMHINDLIENPKTLDQYQILAVPGGFSYGDDTGSGNAFAQKMRLALWDPLKNFVARDTLTIGICNGCQILANLGMVPPAGHDYGARLVAVTYNLTARYQCRWIDLKIHQTGSPWLEGIEHMHVPVAHGEGRFMMEKKVLQSLQANNQVAAQYVKRVAPHPPGFAGPLPLPPGEGVRAHARTGEGSSWTLANGEFPFNPNGSTADIAALTDASGRVLAIMPHPERGMFTWQRDDYDRLKDRAQRERTTLPEEADGLALFYNAARYFEVKVKHFV